MRRLLFGAITLAAFSNACGSTSADDSQSNDLTGTTSVERQIEWMGEVFVSTTASSDAITAAVAKQVKTSVGAFHTLKLLLNERFIERNLDTTKFIKKELTSPDGTKYIKVSYVYSDRAVVTTSLNSKSAISFTLLMPNYSDHYDAVNKDCGREGDLGGSFFWYDYAPEKSACSKRISAETTAIAKERIGKTDTQVGTTELNRWFLPVTAKLSPLKTPAQAFAPEYDRLYGTTDGKSTIAVYAFHGVDKDASDPDDILAQEAMKFLRTVLKAQPNLRPVYTEPFAMLLDINVDGTLLQNVTYENMFQWIVDRKGYPSQVGTDSVKILNLRKQALSKFAERWVYWQLPLEVTDKNGTTRKVTIELRNYFGSESGSDDAIQKAKWRYLEAFWYGDVFMYNGHSHLGYGPLAPENYAAWNFNERYQVMLVNSCISFNYYEQDFFKLKPGGSKNLELITNGMSSYISGSGEASAKLFTSLFDGTQKSYKDILSAMRITAGGESAYDPMRVADGELDNTYSASTNPIRVKVLPPVY